MKQNYLVGLESMQCIRTNMKTSMRNLERLRNELNAEEDQKAVRSELYCVEELIACAQEIIEVCDSCSTIINYNG